MRKIRLKFLSTDNDNNNNDNKDDSAEAMTIYLRTFMFQRTKCQALIDLVHHISRKNCISTSIFHQCITFHVILISKGHNSVEQGSSGGVVNKFFACRARGLGFDSQCLTARISEICFLLLQSPNMGEISLKRCKS